jgi:hypothetical protein
LKPPILDHWPFQSGNVVSSKAAAPGTLSNSAAKAKIELRWGMRTSIKAMRHHRTRHCRRAAGSLNALKGGCGPAFVQKLEKILILGCSGC